MNAQGMLRVRCYCDEMDGFVSQDIINMKYCPVCGEKFKVIV
jgi:Zn finger protein HypA/HybF involved in hydrogenase expression